MPMNCQTFTYQCTDCETKSPVELDMDSFEDPPPDVVTTICGKRWGGCGEVKVLELVNDDGDE